MVPKGKFDVLAAFDDGGTEVFIASDDKEVVLLVQVFESKKLMT